MNGAAIAGVIQAAKAENTEFGRKADVYLKFGLPRVAVLGVETVFYTLALFCLTYLLNLR